jgi:hypothetical protein
MGLRIHGQSRMTPLLRCGMMGRLRITYFKDGDFRCSG